MTTSRAPFMVTAGTSNATAEQYDAQTLKEANKVAKEWIEADKPNVSLHKLTPYTEHQYEYMSIPLPKAGRPKERQGEYQRITLEMRPELVTRIDAQVRQGKAKSRRDYIEQLV